MQSVHHLHPRLMGSTRPLRVLLVGAGGSGSAVLLQLPFLEQALRAWGQPGLAVTVMDPDTVSEVNVVRQPFSHVDIGSNKAMCLVGRINMFWGFAAQVHLNVLDPDCPGSWGWSRIAAQVHFCNRRQGVIASWGWSRIAAQVHLQRRGPFPVCAGDGRESRLRYTGLLVLPGVCRAGDGRESRLRYTRTAVSDVGVLLGMVENRGSGTLQNITVPTTYLLGMVENRGSGTLFHSAHR